MNVILSSQAKKFLRHAEADVRERIADRIIILAKNPYDREAKKLEGSKEKLFRVRVGDFRILYEIDYRKGFLNVVKIDKRDRIY